MNAVPEHDVQRARALAIDVAAKCAKDRWALFPPHARDLLGGRASRGVVLFGLRSPTFLEHLRAVESAVRSTPGLELVALVDDDPALVPLPELGYPVLSAKAFFENPGTYADCLAVDRYCTWLPGVKYKQQFRRIGMECLRLEQFLNSPALADFPGFYRGNSDYMLAHFDELLALEGCWADGRSAQVYYTVLAGFISMDFTYFALTCDDHRERYFPSDVGFVFGEDEVLLDCGSHHGGEILIFAAKTRDRFKAIHGFEPALDNFGVLTRNMARYMAERGIDNIRCYPLGVYDRNDYLAFAGADTILTVSDQRAADGQGVFVARLDDIVEEATCLRLEVEGAEGPALRGAAGLIGRHRPRLVVSAYHRPDDFLTLSRQIQEFDLGYSFRLRHQSLEAGVLCFYCS